MTYQMIKETYEEKENKKWDELTESQKIEYAYEFGYESGYEEA